MSVSARASKLVLEHVRALHGFKTSFTKIKNELLQPILTTSFEQILKFCNYFQKIHHVLKVKTATTYQRK